MGFIMKMPWANKTGLAKAATLFATLLLVSLGLCGVNFAAVIAFVGVAGGPPPPGTPTWPTTLLTTTGAVELIGVALGACGLVITGIWLMGSYRIRKPKKSKEMDKN
jgi:hypothetical protein